MSGSIVADSVNIIVTKFVSCLAFHDRGIGTEHSIIYFEFFTAVLLNYWLSEGKKCCVCVMKNELYVWETVKNIIHDVQNH